MGGPVWTGWVAGLNLGIGLMGVFNENMNFCYINLVAGVFFTFLAYRESQ